MKYRALQLVSLALVCCLCPRADDEAGPVDEAEPVEEAGPVEDVVVVGERTPDETAHVGVVTLPMSRSVLVGTDGRSGLVVDRMEEARAGEPPLSGFADRVRDACRSMRLPGDAAVASRSSHRKRQRDRLRRLYFPSTPLRRMVWTEYQCSGKRLAAEEAVTRAWRLTATETERLAGLDAGYLDDLAVFAYEMRNPRPPEEGLTKLLGGGDNDAKQWVRDVVGVQSNAR